MCHRGTAGTGKSKTQAHAFEFASCFFYIRIELDRSNVDGRSFQASTDKMLYFQGLYGFRRDSPAFLNDCKAIENTGQTGFFGISDDSSQIVVTVISLQEQHFRKNIKTRCLQNYKQRIFICRSIIKIVSNHILGGGWSAYRQLQNLPRRSSAWKCGKSSR